MGKLNKYLNGISFKGLLSEANQKLMKEQEGCVAVREDSETEEEREDFFYLKSIKEKEAVLAHLLETRTMPEKKQFVPGAAATFLTQVFKESDCTQKELDAKFDNWPVRRNIVEASKAIINSHATSKEIVAH